MINFDNQLDITKNIKMIEVLKVEILERVSKLQSSFIETDSTTSDKAEICTDLTILIYILANRIGVSPDSLLLRINKKLKIGVLDDDNIFRDDTKEILKHFKNI